MAKVKYLKSAVLAQDYPQGNNPEVAITGRSNAGKSSFINSIAGDNVAKVSKSPGKTRLLNFFDVGESYRLVDMPGYGFAARSGPEMLDWREMIENYLTIRGQLKCVILIMDIRREWEEDEELLKRFLNNLQKPLVVALNKSDKISKAEIEKTRKTIIRQSGTTEVFCISSLKNQGVEDFEDYIYKTYIKGAR